jgi:hypothetical protein
MLYLPLNSFMDSFLKSLRPMGLSKMPRQAFLFLVQVLGKQSRTFCRLSSLARYQILQEFPFITALAYQRMVFLSIDAGEEQTLLKVQFIAQSVKACPFLVFHLVTPPLDSKTLYSDTTCWSVISIFLPND